MAQKLTFTGTQTISTERLILRRFEQKDAPVMFHSWAGDPVVTRYLTWQTHKDETESAKIIALWLKSYANPEFFQWAIAAKDDNVVIGAIDLHEVNERLRRAEIGYALSQKYWNRGIMTEALRAVLDFGFNKVGFERIEGYHKVENKASGRVMLKAGMSYEGTLKKYGISNTGELVDCDMYASII